MRIHGKLTKFLKKTSPTAVRGSSATFMLYSIVLHFGAEARPFRDTPIYSKGRSTSVVCVLVHSSTSTAAELASFAEITKNHSPPTIRSRENKEITFFPPGGKKGM